MKSLLFILLAGYAVRSDENNYYVVERLDDPPTQFKKPFKVYWNVPTMQCASKKIYFEKLYEKFGIIQNDNDRFKGEKVTILYDPGLFPALFKNETSGKFRFRNGGVPQEGNLDKHLDEFKKELDTSVPDKDFSGVGIIDFESWRPVFRQNFGVLVPYKDVSFEIERKLHFWWPKAWIEAEAKRRFEESARTFMQTTLSVAKQLRPRALWGFYGFPYCFNMASNNMAENCASKVPQENDRIPWLWSESTALYPSVYSSASLSTAQLVALIRGRIREAARNARGDTILPYFWFRYRDAGYLSETDLKMALSTLYTSNASGAIMWGSSNDVNTVAKCNKLLKYVETVLGPAIAKYTKPPTKLNDENIDQATLSSINVSTDSPLFNDSSNLNTKIDLDPEFHWTPPENYSQDIKTYVDEEIKKKFGQNVTADDYNTVLQNNSILIDLILNALIINSVDVPSSDISKTNKNKNGLSEDLSLVNSTEVNVKVTSTETSQITSSVVTNNTLLNEVNNTSPQVEPNVYDIISSISPKTVEKTTTEKIEFQIEDIDESDFKLELGTIDSLFDITTNDKSNVNEATDSYIDATLDGDEDYFFNFNTFIKNYPTTTTVDDSAVDETATDYVIKTSTNSIKSFYKTSTEDNLLKTSDLGTTDDVIDINLAITDGNDKSKTPKSDFIDEYFTTESTNENSKSTVEKNKVQRIRENFNIIDTSTDNNKEFIESSTQTETTRDLDFNRPDTTINIPLSFNHSAFLKDSIDAIETSTYNDEMTTKTTITHESETINSFILTTEENSQIFKVSKTTENVSDATRKIDTAEESEATSTNTPEETTPTLPTSTDQVFVHF